jgi:hypothetical protein
MGSTSTYTTYTESYVSGTDLQNKVFTGMNLGFKEILFVRRSRPNQYFLCTRRWFQFFMLPFEEEYKNKHFAGFYENNY